MPAFGPCRRACGCAGLFFLPPDSAVLSVFAASLFAPSFFPSSVFLLPARISLCPHLPLPVSPSVRVSLSPHLASFVGPSSFVCIPSGFSSVISCFSVHRPSLAACCPSPVAPSIVHRLPLVVHRSLRRSSFIARRLLSVARCPSPVAPSIVHRPPLVGGCPYPVAAPRLFPLPFGPDHGFCIRGIPACVSSGAACRVVPQRVPTVGLSAKMCPPSVPWSPRRF